LSASKPEIINKISNNFPNLYKKDLNKFFDILLFEITKALSSGERVELRDVFTIEPRTQKSGFRRNPKNGVSFFAKEKKKIFFKMSKKWAKKINEK